jgi:hypothetical protein
MLSQRYQLVPLTSSLATAFMSRMIGREIKNLSIRDEEKDPFLYFLQFNFQFIIYIFILYIRRDSTAQVHPYRIAVKVQKKPVALDCLGTKGGGKKN